MDKTTLTGVGHQLKGAIKERLGKLIGDAKLVADGKTERADGQAEAASGEPDRSLGVDSDRIKGAAHQIKGSVISGIGNLIGNTDLERSGAAEQAAGKRQNEAGSARDAAIEAGGTHTTDNLP
jgi:uncharacterized protein YjbJ (UPF0337 family)